MLRISRRWACLLLLAVAGAAGAQSEPKPDPAQALRPAPSAGPQAVGGPDAQGYRFSDSNEAGGPAFGWLDIPGASPTVIALGDDQHQHGFAVPFDFQFYGVSRPTLAISSNGTVYFENVYLGLSNIAIPGTPSYTMSEYAFIAAYWDDLAPNYGGQVRYAVLGAAPKRRAVVEFSDVRSCCNVGNPVVSYQVVLYEGSNDVRIQYGTPTTLDGSGATVGIQGSPSVGLQYSLNAPVVAPNLAICFEAPGSDAMCTLRYDIAASVAPAGAGSVSGAGNYAEGAPVTLGATANPHYLFQGWSGGVTSTDNPLNFTATADITLTANFVPVEYTLDVTLVGNGTVQRTPEQATYHFGDVVSLTPVPAPGWVFTGWSGDAGGNAEPLSLTIGGNTAVTATFAPLYGLTLNSVGAGTATVSPPQSQFVAGAQATITASPQPGWSFAGWSGDASGSSNPLVLTMDADKSVTATFTQDQYTLVIEVVGSGNATATPTQATYTYGTPVDLLAAPAPGWEFVGWSGDVSAVSPGLTTSITGNTHVVATFAQSTYPLTTTTAGSGAVTVSPLQAGYTYGQQVTLTALPQAGWSFAGWSGALAGSANPATLAITEPTTVNANFSQDQYTLTVSTAGSGSVTRLPQQATHVYGDTVLLTAQPAPGWSFAGWSGGASGSAPQVEVTIVGDTDVTASFTQDAVALTTATVGSGSITRSPDLASYAVGSQVTLTAVPAPGWRFSTWSGAAAGNANPLTLTMNAASTMTAHFVETPFTVSASSVGNGSFTIAPQASGYAAGDVVTVTATPAPGWAFIGWSGGAGGSANPLQITVQGNVTLQGGFAQLGMMTIPATDRRVLALTALLALVLGGLALRRR